MSISDNIISAAKSFLGTPYVWGGESMTEGGFDCSGFVYNALNKAGIKVNRLTAQGYFNTFKNNKCTKDVKGALLFFGKSTSNITHIAISNGDGTMYESIGGSKNTKYNPGKGVSHTNINRRKDLVAVCAPFKIENTTTVTKTNTCVVAQPTLKKKSTGEQVSILQQNLNSVLKINLEVDGDFGGCTESAVKAFQTLFMGKKETDGIYGPKTFKVLSAQLGI
jgi:cell wall-associated NlpC family hydrolase